MNIQTSNGMGLDPKGMQLKASAGMGIQTGNGMGIPASKGMGLASDQNYFKFNEYQRKQRYFFGDRGKGRHNAATTTTKPPLVAKMAGNQVPKAQIYQPGPQTSRPPHQNSHRRFEPRTSRHLAPQRQMREVSEREVMPTTLQASSWKARSRVVKHGREVAVYCDCFFCELDKFKRSTW